MRILVRSAVVLAAALAVSACGGSHRVISAKSVPPHSPTTPLMKRLAVEARDQATSLGDPSVKTAQVYGPDSRYLLVKASSGDVVQKIAAERTGFYLIVLHGRFVCRGCTAPLAGAKPARGRIATEVWSPKTGQTDFGIGNEPVAMARLHGPTVMAWASRA